jgi:hypothetical protein
MLLELGETINNQIRILSKNYKGIVVDNADPLKLGRVKVTISGLIEGEASKLPWISQRSSTTLGGQSAKGTFFAPLIGAELEIEFKNDDIYSGEYIGYWQTPNTHNSAFDDKYPDKYGWVDDGFEVAYDSKAKEFTIEHPEGARIVIKPDGSVEITTPNKVKVAGTGGTEIGDSSSVTKVNGSKVILADGGPPIARHGDTVVGQVPQSPSGTNPLVNGTIIATSTKMLGG